MTDHASPETDDLTALPDSARRVALLLRERGHAGRIVMLPETGKTSAEAAAGLGCSVAQIAKSILFRRREWALGAAVVGLTIGLYVLMAGPVGAPLHEFSVAAYRSLTRLNAFSVGSLMLFMAYLTIRSRLAQRRAASDAALRSG